MQARREWKVILRLPLPYPVVSLTGFENAHLLKFANCAISRTEQLKIYQGIETFYHIQA